jgi:hypothetical protein
MNTDIRQQIETALRAFSRFRPAPRPDGIGIPRENSEMHHTFCATRHACYSTGVRRFFKQVSHKAPLTHKEGGAFLFCLGKPNSPIVVHSSKQRPCSIGYAVDRGGRLAKKEKYDLLD